MVTNSTKLILFSLWVLFVFYGCVEQIEPEIIEETSSILVVDATITDELKYQKILLTRAITFDKDEPLAEGKAQVTVVEEEGDTFVFRETVTGTYESERPFAASAGRNYQLRIITENGNSYNSKTMNLPAASEISKLYAERITTDLGDDGMGIFVDAFDAGDKAKFYRYEYEETYKVVAPFYNPNDLENVPPAESEFPCQVRIIPDLKSKEVCYATDTSRSIILASTGSLDQNDLSRYMVRFIDRNNYIISHRYSILVRQYAQSNEAYTFYETLNDLSTNESLLSETQTGFVEGNVSSVNESEKVLGYFDVASVTEQRIFFDYVDFYVGEKLPPYVNPCMENAPLLSAGVPPNCTLGKQIEQDLIRYIDVNDGSLDGGPYKIVPRVCGDCTALGSPEVPDFWVD